MMLLLSPRGVAGMWADSLDTQLLWTWEQGDVEFSNGYRNICGIIGVHLPKILDEFESCSSFLKILWMW